MVDAAGDLFSIIGDMFSLLFGVLWLFNLILCIWIKLCFGM